MKKIIVLLALTMSSATFAERLDTQTLIESKLNSSSTSSSALDKEDESNLSKSEKRQLQIAERKAASEMAKEAASRTSKKEILKEKTVSSEVDIPAWSYMLDDNCKKMTGGCYKQFIVKPKSDRVLLVNGNKSPEYMTFPQTQQQQENAVQRAVEHNSSVR